MLGTATSSIYVFGDSLTQYGYDQSQSFAWVAALSHHYSRKLAVINAGLSGYSTDKAHSILSRILPTPSSSSSSASSSAPSPGISPIKLFVLFFGANDARLPSTGIPEQHVPLESFRSNLRAMATLPELHERHPGTKILLVTPPPVDERLCEQDDAGKGIFHPRRTAETTAMYAQAVRDVGAELVASGAVGGGDLAVLDLWDHFMRVAGWVPGEPLVGSKDVEQIDPGKGGLGTLLKDGVHLTGEGNRVLFEELVGVVNRTWPELDAERLGFDLPYWGDGEAWKHLEEVRDRDGG
ncbi:hypothetical protein KC343_g10575 [Hortaea werneckii]|uniref:SGNH hydrolase-type esterase domain-containing protein n=1 Tax=Hortaea werneckii TaxID=91943 RepID=A0A3M7GMA4_HORWE|nr:hypothetical protein KC352_g19649 [Hortaea werneckii]KAI7558848.1 hypothetical protein KC317_g10738 [Hortaea werneckii]KAI7606643.1 hypothetical protein KC346_g10433 [Hortaea werneckii]KAI7614267.1 hypothetical protein KC343_g10575 [Hortaea werneckii]KAI7654179.1 hypothetical protein KC319_g10336 [Hortaea werneckii]